MTLYRKYRPKSFGDVVGQLHVRSTLLAELTGDAVAHAYVLVGPRGVGKTTVARLLAKAVNCEHAKNGEPDNRCPSCTAMNEGRSLDLIEIDAASHTQVDHVRENILPAARTAPATGRFKVFIIDEVHMLSTSAFNALLKILEEPPAHVIFILATTEVHRVPSTIISRCQRFDFHRVRPADIVKRLTHVLEEEGLRADRSVLERIARLSQGSLRDAESMLGQLAGLGERHITPDVADVVLPRSDIQSAVRLVELMAGGQAGPALELVQRLADEGLQIGPFMRECVELGRECLLRKLGVTVDSFLISGDEEKDIERFIQSVSVGWIEGLIDAFMRRERDEKFVSTPQLPLELAVVDVVVGQAPTAAPEVRPGGERTTVRKTAVTPARHPANSSTHLAATAVNAQWPKILEEIRATNPSLGLLLKTARPRAIVDGVLGIEVEYEFHRERILGDRSRQAVETAVRKILQAEVRIDAIVAHPAPEPQQSSTDVWAQALKSFSGSAAGTNDTTP